MVFNDHYKQFLPFLNAQAEGPHSFPLKEDPGMHRNAWGRGQLGAGGQRG